MAGLHQGPASYSRRRRTGKECAATLRAFSYHPGDMPKTIAIIQGHPDPKGQHFGHALADAYAQAARKTGHEVTLIDVSRLEFPLLRTKDDFERGVVPAAIQTAQAVVQQAQHLVIFYPLWLGGMPALLKGFFEQLFRPDFISGDSQLLTSRPRRLTGKSARIVVTMGMPAWVYRWYFGAHSLKSLERNILKFCGVGPVRETLIGLVESPSPKRRAKWLEAMRQLGGKAG
jgi:putative NADPH-quinone reductase